MSLPDPRASRLQNFVATMMRHGNTPANLNLETLAKFNPWTTADELLVEFKIQQNGSRKLPEEVAVTSLAVTQIEDEE
jgi:hypothetical protein